MRRTAPPAAALLLLTGCEQQEAVPLARSVPVACAQLLVLAVGVFGGFAVLERSARRRSRPAPGRSRGALDVLGTVLFGAVGAALVGVLALGIASVPGTYRTPTVDVFSWEDSVAIGWMLMVPVVPVALLELRLAAACWAGRRWAGWAAGTHLALAAIVALLGVAG